MSRRILFAAIVLFATNLFAQQHENVARGFEAGKSYAMGDIDTVNTFNGNVTLSIPIGQSFPLSTRLSYRFMLHYNSLAWDIEEAERNIVNSNPPGAVEVVTVAYPDRRSNAGMGWSFGFGQLFPPFAKSNDNASWIYQSEDGSEHGLIETPTGGTYFSNDGSFIRAKDAGERVVVELPNGVVQEFEESPDGASRPWRIVVMHDLFEAPSGSSNQWMNWVSVDYETIDGQLRWKVQDSVGRTHYVTFKDYHYDTITADFVESVQLDGWGSTTPTYHFTYLETAIPRHTDDTDDPNTSLYTGGLTDHPQIQALTQVKLTDGAPNGTDLGYTFDMTYRTGGTIARSDSGVLRTLRLPTKGLIEWIPGNYKLPLAPDPFHEQSTYAEQTVAGVYQRVVTDPATGVSGTWTYAHTLYPRYDPPSHLAEAREATNTITDPSGNVTKLYFNVLTEDSFNGWTRNQYGMAASPIKPESGGLERFVSKEEYQGETTLKRTTYVKLVGDRDYSRTEQTKVVYEDDSQRYIHTSSDPASYDGYGHYRTTTTTTNFNGSPRRETYTNYTPQTGDSWLINLYTEQKATEFYDSGTTNKSELRRTFQFDTDTGFLEQQRTLTSTTNAATDVREVFTPDANGNVAQQDIYGGDDRDADATTPRYRIVSTYAKGVPKTSKYQDPATGQDVGFLTLNVDVDTGTSLVNVSRDSAEPGTETSPRLTTSFTYDAAGRIKTITPPGIGTNVVSVAYSNAESSSTFTPATISVSSGTIQQVQQFDGLGRLWREKTHMPDGTWSLRETTRDNQGRTVSVSEPETLSYETSEFDFHPVRATTYSNFDAFGRARLITKPDLKTVGLAFTGDRITRTTSSVTTASGDQLTVLEEERDGFGRLHRVRENADGSSDWLQSSYQYDAGDRLIDVQTTDGTTTQARTFEYDGRGFLKSETHPESGQTSYTYDARGHAVTRTTPVAQLGFAYDAAERLLTVTDGGQTLKEYKYDRPTVEDADYSLGKVDYAIRHNRVLGKDTLVKEKYTYGGRAGALSAKTTTVSTDGVVENTFEERYTYDPDGALQTLAYPTCASCQTLPPSLTVLNTYHAGMLQKVGRVDADGAFASAIGYHAGGMWTSIQHTNVDGSAGPLDTQTPDPDYPVRPQSIEFSNFCTNFSVSQHPGSTSIPFGGSVDLTAAAAGATSWKWFANGQEMQGEDVNTNTISVHPTATTTYFARASNGTCTADSMEAVVTVGADCSNPPTITMITQPQPMTVVTVPGTSVSLSVFASSSAPLSYQWFEGEPGSGPAIDGATTSTYATPALTASTRYWVRISTGCTSINSAAAVIVVDTCPFTVVGKGGQSDFESADIVNVSVASGDAATLEVGTVVREGEAPLQFTYEWAGYPELTGPIHTFTGITSAKTIDVTVKGWRGGDYVCSRTISFHVTPCTASFELEAGSCEVLSNKPHVYVRLGTTITFHAQVVKLAPDNPTAPPPMYHFKWAPANGMGPVMEDDGPGALMGFEYKVPNTVAEVPAYFDLTVTGAGCARKIRMPVTVLNEPACTGPDCSSSCVIGLVRVNGEAHQAYHFTSHEEVVLTPPQELPSNVSRFEWHRVLNGVDEVYGITENLALTLMTPAKYYFRGLKDGVWYTSATLSTALTTSSPGITIEKDYQSPTVPAGSLVKLTVNVTGAPPTDYEWRIGSEYDLSTPVIATTGTLEMTVRHDRVVWCHVKQNGVWLRSPIAEVLTSCTLAVSGTAVAHPQFVGRDGSSLVGAAPYGKIRTMYWYERDPDGPKTFLTSGFSSAVNFYPTKAVTKVGADLVDSCSTTGSLTEATVYLCVPSIERQPVGIVITGGTSATLTAEAKPAIDGQSVTTIWYKADDVNRTNPLHEGGSFTTPVLSAGSVETYVADFRGECTPTVNYTVHSATATVEACVPPVLVDHTPERWSSTPGTDVGLSVSAQGKELTYQWYEGPSGDTSKPLSGKTEPQLIVYPQTTTSYWCRIKAQGVCVTDTPVTTVRVCSPATIVTHPQSARLFGAATVTLSVTADAGTNTEPLTYQWQQKIGESWTNIGGETERTFTTSAVAGTTLNYRAVVSTGICAITSNAASVTMCTYPEVVAAEAPETRVAYDASVYLRLPDLSPVEEKQVTWYRGASGDQSQPIRSGTGTNFLNDTGPITGTSYFWAEFSNQGCVSRTETYTVRACVPTITQQASGAVVAAGSPIALSIGATPIPGQTYQWYAGAAGVTTAPVSNGNAASVSVSPSSTTTYWCRVTTPCGLSEDSAVATITTCTSPQIDSITVPQSVPSGTLVQLSASATGDELTYQWYRGAAGDVSNPVGSGPTASVQVMVTTTFWCRVKSRGVCTTDSASTTVSICTTPSITTQPASQPLFAGNSATLSVAASPLPVTYQWYVGTAGTTTNAIQGATGSSITVQPTATTSYWVRVSNEGCHAQSNTATVTACVFPQQVNAAQPTTNIQSGDSVTLSLPTLSPAADKSVTWYRGAPGNRTTVVASGMNAVYTAAHTQSGQFWAEFTHDGCTSSTTAYAINVCKPVITAQPQSSIINAGQNASLGVTATGEGLTYQWYIGTAGNTSAPISGATQSTYAPSPAATTSYWVRITGCTTADSATATVTICQTPQITAQPQNVIATASGATLTVTATGTELTYQWYEGSTLITGSGNSITVNPSTTTYYRVRVTGRCGSPVDSAQAMVSVAPSIGTQPASAAVTSGATRVLTVAASGTVLSYQWYERTGGTVSLINGATGTSYTTPSITTERRFFCRVKSGEATKDSNDAVLTVCQPAGIVAGNYPTDVSGSLFIYNIANPVAGETYEWYQGASGQTNIPLGTGSSLSVRPALTTQYWVRTKRAGCDADSPAVTAKICIPAIVEQPLGDYVFAGTQKTLSVSATGTPTLTYQWYRGAAGDTSTPVGTGPTYTFTANATASYWVRVSSPSAGCPSSSRDSDVATVTVCQPPQITEQPHSDNYAKNAALTLSVTAEGANLQYQWYRGNKGDTSNPVGTNSCTLTLTATATQAYWVRVTGNCASTDSEAALVSVFPTITQQPAATSVCALGDTASFSMTATGADSYQWYRVVNGGAAELVGTGASLSIPITAVPVNFYARAISGNAATSTNSATATVLGTPTITSFTAPQYSPPAYTLTAVVASGDSSLVGYRFYQGALGNTTTLLVDSTTNYKTVTPPSLPMQYWVRVYYKNNPTKCFANAGLSVP